MIVGLAQWVVPAQMIWKREEVLQKGKTFRFLTEPVDPTNPFIGKYITLNFKEDAAWVKKKASEFKRDQTIYVLFKTDNAGFAFIDSITTKEPVKQTDYVKAKVYYSNNYNDSTELHINYPFDEFYMEEHKAPKAEAEYLKVSRDTTISTYAQVRIWKGTAVTENVFIDNKPLTSYFK